MASREAGWAGEENGTRLWESPSSVARIRKSAPCPVGVCRSGTVLDWSVESLAAVAADHEAPVTGVGAADAENPSLDVGCLARDDLIWSRARLSEYVA
jgi:hypothetical protein